MEWLGVSAADLGTIAVTVFGTAWGAVKYFGKRMIDQHDKLAERVNKLERDYVNRKELADLREELSRNNRDIQAQLHQILQLLAKK